MGHGWGTDERGGRDYEKVLWRRSWIGFSSETARFPTRFQQVAYQLVDLDGTVFTRVNLVEQVGELYKQYGVR